MPVITIEQFTLQLERSTKMPRRLAFLCGACSSRIELDEDQIDLLDVRRIGWFCSSTETATVCPGPCPECDCITKWENTSIDDLVSRGIMRWVVRTKVDALIFAHHQAAAQRAREQDVQKFVGTHLPAAEAASDPPGI